MKLLISLLLCSFVFNCVAVTAQEPTEKAVLDKSKAYTQTQIDSLRLPERLQTDTTLRWQLLRLLYSDSTFFAGQVPTNIYRLQHATVRKGPLRDKAKHVVGQQYFPSFQTGSVEGRIATLKQYQPGFLATDSLKLHAVTSAIRQSTAQQMIPSSGNPVEQLKDIAHTAADTLTVNHLTKTHKIELKRLASTLPVNKPDSLGRVTSSLSTGIPAKWSDVTQAGFSKLPQTDQFKHLRGKMDSLVALQKQHEDLLKLPSITSSVLQKEFEPQLDSIRKVYVAANRLQARERALEEGHKEVLLKQKDSFLQRSYFEGIVGVNHSLNYLTLSPAFGTKLVKALSGGLGVNVGMNIRNLSESPLIGLRSFAKYELIARKLNLQLEDNSYLRRPATVTSLSEGTNRRLNHLVYVGVGYLIRYTSTRCINLTTLYQINRNTALPELNAPFVIRLGLSFFKPTIE